MGEYVQRSNTGILFLVIVPRRLGLGFAVTRELAPGRPEVGMHRLDVSGQVVLATEDARAAGVLARVRALASMH